MNNTFKNNLDRYYYINGCSLQLRAKDLQSSNSLRRRLIQSHHLYKRFHV